MILILMLSCTLFWTAYYKTRNAGTRNTGGTAEHPGTVVVEQWYTPEYPRDTNVTTAEYYYLFICSGFYSLKEKGFTKKYKPHFNTFGTFNLMLKYVLLLIQFYI